MATESIERRFWSKVSIGDECWLWLGATRPNGYGMIQAGERTKDGKHRQTGAHRVAYKLFVGAIPDGMDVCHHCDTPGCVRPDHLFVGSRRDNMADSKAKGRTGWRWRPLKTHCKHGHALSGDNLYMNGSKRFCRTCNRQRDGRREWQASKS